MRLSADDNSVMELFGSGFNVLQGPFTEYFRTEGDNEPGKRTVGVSYIEIFFMQPGDLCCILLTLYRFLDRVV